MIGTMQALLTTTEAADFLKLSPFTLQTWRSRGSDGPPWIEVGGVIRYQMADLERWLDERRRGTAQA